MNTEIKDNQGALEETASRKTSQYLMPAQLTGALAGSGEYDIYPFCSVGDGKILNGPVSLGKWIAEQKTVMIDGYAGVFYDTIREDLNTLLVADGLTVNWIKTGDFFKNLRELEELVAPFLGDYESVWGTKCTLTLADIFEMDELAGHLPDEQFDINIIIGPGAALAKWDAAILYIDLPKNELQFRMRAGSVTNLGATETAEPFQMYKRFYFVDWVLLNNHKKAILDKITAFADGQWPDTINWMLKSDLSVALNQISRK